MTRVFTENNTVMKSSVLCALSCGGVSIFSYEKIKWSIFGSMLCEYPCHYGLNILFLIFNSLNQLCIELITSRIWMAQWSTSWTPIVREALWIGIHVVCSLLVYFRPHSGMTEISVPTWNNHWISSLNAIGGKLVTLTKSLMALM